MNILRAKWFVPTCLAIVLIALLTTLFFMFCSRDEIFFVPGWNSDTDFNRGIYWENLREMYPRAKITICSWKSNVGWGEAKGNASQYAQKLAGEIEKMPNKRRQNIILIGHSLGGKIIVDVCKILKDKNVRFKFKQIILLGAAVDCRIDKTPYDILPELSSEPVINVFSWNDGILKYAYVTKENILPVGLCGIQFCDEAKVPKGIKQYHFAEEEQQDEVNINSDLAINSLINHSAEKYLSFLAKINARKTYVKEYKNKYDYSKINVEFSKDELKKRENDKLKKIYWEEEKHPFIFFTGYTENEVKQKHASWTLFTMKFDTNDLAEVINAKKKSENIGMWENTKIKTLEVALKTVDSVHLYYIIDQYGIIRDWYISKEEAERDFELVKQNIPEIQGK